MEKRESIKEEETEKMLYYILPPSGKYAMDIFKDENLDIDEKIKQIKAVQENVENDPLYYQYEYGDSALKDEWKELNSAGKSMIIDIFIHYLEWRKDLRRRLGLEEPKSQFTETQV